MKYAFESARAAVFALAVLGSLAWWGSGPRWVPTDKNLNDSYRVYLAESDAGQFEIALPPPEKDKRIKIEVPPGERCRISYNGLLWLDATGYRNVYLVADGTRWAPDGPLYWPSP